MKRFSVALVAVMLSLALGSVAEAQPETQPEVAEEAPEVQPTTSVVTPAAQVRRSPPRCNVGADPVDAFRQPTADEEVVPNPADKQITYTSGNGRDVTCVLEAGVPVVADKATGIVGWVYGCGNVLVTPTDWVVKQPPSILATALAGINGQDGARGPRGPRGRNGQPGQGAIGPEGPAGRDGFDGRDFTPTQGGCGTTCKVLIFTSVAIVGAIIATRGGDQNQQVTVVVGGGTNPPIGPVATTGGWFFKIK